MSTDNIKPEKITHPIQLMASWFVLVIVIDSGLLIAASKITEPKWVIGLFCISAVSIPVIAMIAVFLMLTKFRPHLQESKEYSRWLRDERKMSTTGSKRNSHEHLNRTKENESNINLQSLINEAIAHNGVNTFKEIEFIKGIMTTPIEVNLLEDADEVANALRRLGFQTTIYKLHDKLREHKEDQRLESHEAIWLGSRVPAQVAITAIKQVLGYWPHLKYIDLSEDHSAGPDYTHYEIFFGGATSTAKSLDLKQWTNAEISAIDDNIGLEEFHNIIKSKY
jgi:hypothetical protein